MVLAGMAQSLPAQRVPLVASTEQAQSLRRLVGGMYDGAESLSLAHAARPSSRQGHACNAASRMLAVAVLALARHLLPLTRYTLTQGAKKIHTYHQEQYIFWIKGLEAMPNLTMLTVKKDY